MRDCCVWRLLTLPFGWRGRTTYCRCGTKAVFEKRGSVTFIRGRTSFVLTDGEARRLYEANEEQPCPIT